MKKPLFTKKEWTSPGRLVTFLNKKGFYIVLFLCVLIIAGTGVYVTKMNMDYFGESAVIGEQPAIDEMPVEEPTQPEDEAMTVSNLPAGLPDESGEKNENIQPDLEDIPAEVQKPKNGVKEAKPVVVKQQPVTKTEKQQPTANEPQKKAEQPKKPKKIDKLLPPLEGDIILEFAVDKLIYSKTLEQWCTHKGIDIKSDRGTPVKAAADGVIEKIYHDDKLGITIVIDHGNNIKTKYCNLSTDNMVKEQQEVRQGEVISGVGDTAAFEIGDQPHLHFEVINDGKNIDPRSMLPN